MPSSKVYLFITMTELEIIWSHANWKKPLNMRKPTAWSKIWIYGFLGARVGEGFRIFFFLFRGWWRSLRRSLKVVHWRTLGFIILFKGERIAPLLREVIAGLFSAELDIRLAKTYLSRAFCLLSLEPKGGSLTTKYGDNY